MPRFDKAGIKSGMFITGGDYKAELMSSAAPVVYGRPLSLPKPDFGEIERRLEEAKKKLDEIVRRRR